jgi:ADP-heptose:LPS heptosyltransferase
MIRLVLVARAIYAKPIMFLLSETFNRIYFVDKNEFAGKEDVIGTAINYLDDLTNRISSEDIDVLANLSFSKTSAYLCSVIDAKHHLGFYYTTSHEARVPDQWSQFVNATVMDGPFCPFSLVDIFRSMLGAKAVGAPKLAKVNSNANRILIHPFASDPKKYWKESKWVEVLFRFLKVNPNLGVDICGSPDESDRANTIATDPILAPYRNRIRILNGKLQLQELYKALNNYRFAVCHDSLIGHLCALAGLKTMTISLGPVRAMETTPYATGNFVLTAQTKCAPCFPNEACSFYQCHSDLSYQVVSDCIQTLVEKGDITEEEIAKRASPFHLGGLSLLKTEFSKSGFFQLKAIAQTRSRIPDIYRSFYRLTWAHRLAELEEELAYPVLDQDSASVLIKDLEFLQHLYELCEFGKKYSTYILQEISSQTPDVTKIREYSSKIDEVDQLQDMIKANAPTLAPLINFFKVSKANTSGENIVALTEATYLTYNDYGICCSVLFELIEKTVTEFRLKNQKRPTQQQRGNV